MMSASRISPVIGFSASTRTPTSSDVLPTQFIEPRSVNKCPTRTGDKNDTESIVIVTTGRRACRIAASAPASSINFMM